jgi:protocatechuate 3,4-dioxygenase beta subunit
MNRNLTRRTALVTLCQSALGVAAFGASGLTGESAALACGPMECGATAANIEGPFFKPGAPTQSILVRPADMGERLVLTGRVLGRDCQPIAGARIEIWHADAHGAYDNEGNHFRGVLETDAQGAFKLSTVLPGRYLNGKKYRPAHIHAKVHAHGRPVLTTQLYFEGDPENHGDPFIVDSLIMAHTLENGVRRAHFDFVV